MRATITVLTNKQLPLSRSLPLTNVKEFLKETIYYENVERSAEGKFHNIERKFFAALHLRCYAAALLRY